MASERPAPGGYVRVECCGKRRGVLPGGVLVCSQCDYNHDKATVIPNENRARDVPVDRKYWPIWRREER